MKNKRFHPLHLQCLIRALLSLILWTSLNISSSFALTSNVSMNYSINQNTAKTLSIGGYSKIFSSENFTPDPVSWYSKKHHRHIPEADPDWTLKKHIHIKPEFENWLLKKHGHISPEPDPSWFCKKYYDLILYPDPDWLRKKQTGHSGLYFAIKTNLLYWAGITSEANHYPYISNAELEWFAASHFSLTLDGSYVYLHNINGDQEQWGISSIGIEPRYWIAKTNHFIGMFAGVYALTGQFDVKLNHLGQPGHTGDFHEGGISLGYYYPLSPHWGLEAGGRLGARFVNGDIYRFNEPNHFYYRSSFSQNKIGITGIRFSICYRLWKNANNTER